MTFKGLAYALGVMLFFSENVLAAADSDALAISIYNHAHSRNRLALERLKRNGYSLDVVDSKGNTALCTAMIRKDMDAYSLLRQMGADTGHACVKRLEDGM